MDPGFRALFSVNKVWEKAYKVQKGRKIIMNNVIKHNGLYVPSVTKQTQQQNKLTTEEDL